jgi:hypothetical protein
MSVLLIGCLTLDFVTLIALPGDEDKMSVDQILQKAVLAHGGKESLRKAMIAHIVSKGTNYLGPDRTAIPVTIESWRTRSKGKFVLTWELPQGKAVLSGHFDGHQGWAALNGKQMKADEQELQNMKQGSYEKHVKTLVPLLEDKSLSVTSSEHRVIDKKPAVALKIVSKEFPHMVLYFDKQSYLLIGSQSKWKNAAEGQHVVEMVYGKYEDVKGVKVPRHIREWHNGMLFSDMQVETYEFPSKIEDSLFKGE